MVGSKSGTTQLRVEEGQLQTRRSLQATLRGKRAKNTRLWGRRPRSLVDESDAYVDEPRPVDTTFHAKKKTLRGRQTNGRLCEHTCTTLIKSTIFRQAQAPRSALKMRGPCRYSFLLRDDRKRTCHRLFPILFNCWWRFRSVSTMAFLTRFDGCNLVHIRLPLAPILCSVVAIVKSWRVGSVESWGLKSIGPSSGDLIKGIRERKSVTKSTYGEISS